MASNLDYAEDIEEAKAYMAKKNVFQLFEVRKTISLCYKASDLLCRSTSYAGQTLRTSKVLVVEHRFVSVCSCLKDLHQCEDHINRDIEGGFCLLERRFNSVQLINPVVAIISKISWSVTRHCANLVIDHFDCKRRSPPISRGLSTDFFS